MPTAAPVRRLRPSATGNEYLFVRSENDTNVASVAMSAWAKLSTRVER